MTCSRTLILICAGLTVLAAALVFAGVPAGVPGQWVMPPVAGPSWSGLWLALGALALVLLLAGAVFARLETAKRHEVAAALVLLVALIFGLQFGIAALGHVGSQEAFLALATPGTTNLYFGESGAIADPADYLRNYTRHAKEKNGWQLRTHPPGPVMFFYATRRAVAASPLLKNATLAFADRLTPSGLYWRDIDSFKFLDAQLDRNAEAAAWLGVIALRLAAALSIVPLYFLARRIAGRREAFAAAALAGLVPSLLLFNVTIDQLYPLIALPAMLAAYCAAERRSMLLNVLCGLIVFPGMVFSVAFTLFILLIAVMQAWMMFREKHEAAEMNRTILFHVRMLECLVIPVLAGFIILSRTSGFGIMGWLSCFRANALFNAESHRTYAAWLVANPIVFTAFLGVPAAVLFARRIASEGAQVLRERKIAALDPLPVCVFGTIAALWLYGANLGEVERLWMPLMPLCAMVGIARLGLGRAQMLVLLALQGGQAVAFKLALDPLGFSDIIRQFA